MRLSTCNPTTLILSVNEAPEAACKTVTVLAQTDGWSLDDTSPAIANTVGISLHKSSDTLHGVCTDVAGATTVTLSLEATLP